MSEHNPTIGTPGTELLDPSGGRPTVARPTRRKLLVLVNPSDEGRVALRYACLRGKATGSRITLLYVIEPTDFQHWAAVEQRMQDEARQDAEAALYEAAGEVCQYRGTLAELIIREGPRYEEVKALIAEDPDIRVLFLGAGTSKDGPGPLVSRLVNESGGFPIPLMIVPGGLTLEDIEALA